MPKIEVLSIDDCSIVHISKSQISTGWCGNNSPSTIRCAWKYSEGEWFDYGRYLQDIGSSNKSPKMFLLWNQVFCRSRSTTCQWWSTPMGINITALTQKLFSRYRSLYLKACKTSGKKSIYLKYSDISDSQMEPKVDTSGQTIILGVESEEED